MTKVPTTILQGVLLSCGAVSSLMYAATDVVGATNYPGYNYAVQAISEMSAIGAPTTSLLAPYYRLFSFLFVAFAAGVWMAGSRRACLRLSAAFMFAVAIVGVGFSLFPMNMRGAERTFSDTMHLVIAAVTMLLLSGAILSGSKPFDRSFRIYSQASVAVMLGFFVLTLGDAPAVAADAATPFMGINERVSMGTWLLWIAVFSVKLLRGQAWGISTSQSRSFCERGVSQE